MISFPVNLKFKEKENPTKTKKHGANANISPYMKIQMMFQTVLAPDVSMS